MTRRINRRVYWLSILAMLFCSFLLMSEAETVQAKQENSICLLQKKMMLASTNSLFLKKGKEKSVVSGRWRKAKKISVTSKALRLKKKGWYSLLIVTQKGKREIKHVYFHKKMYDIPCNISMKMKEGYYYIVPKGKEQMAVEIQNASLQKKANASVWTRGDSACRIWKLEPAEGKTFRLKNINSGYYLSDISDSGKVTNAVQNKYSAKNQTQLFRAYGAGGNYCYLRCTGTKKYLHVVQNDLEFSSRKAQKAWKFQMKMTTCPGSRVTVTDGTYPSALEEGTPFTLSGMVTSRYTMKGLTVYIVDRAGNTVLSKKAVPNSCFFNIKEVDNEITFGKLSAGTFSYRIAVKDTTGKQLVWINQPFVVTAPEKTIIAPGTASNKMLPYNKNLIQAVGQQANGASLDKKACASYALAYCNAILNNSAPSPRSYWAGSNDVNCVWSKGGYTCSSSGYGSEPAVLQAAYMQIVAGKPCILHVTGNTDQHWLCVIGYKNVTSLQGLSASNFIAIDPWDGNVITVSQKYNVKNTYRLAIKNG